jgi:chromate reductase, NAD(P)H dehydrogenase (quinone)
MFQQKKRVLCIAGSLRRGSWNRKILVAASRLAPDDLVLNPYDRLSEVPMFNEDLEADLPPSVRHLRDATQTADGLLIATPQYNQSFPAVLKNAVDWLSRGDPSCLHGKPVAIVGASIGRSGTRRAQEALKECLISTESRVLNEPTLFVSQAASCFDREGRLSDVSVVESLAQLLRAFGSWIELGSVASYGRISGTTAASVLSRSRQIGIDSHACEA